MKNEITMHLKNFNYKLVQHFKHLVSDKQLRYKNYFYLLILKFKSMSTSHLNSLKNCTPQSVLVFSIIIMIWTLERLNKAS